ncbi:hypothetical protein TUSST3_30040 [Streptomyces sp. TUS-ST3]|nr:hypothetical protein TUSST3_30040 [Streptomyces sp. TUS-ST3]
MAAPFPAPLSSHLPALMQLPARLRLLLMNISLQAARNITAGADTDRAINKREQWWTGHGQEGWLPAC